jgi:hypothetical protein
VEGLGLLQPRFTLRVPFNILNTAFNEYMYTTRPRPRKKAGPLTSIADGKGFQEVDFNMTIATFW